MRLLLKHESIDVNSIDVVSELFKFKDKTNLNVDQETNNGQNALEICTKNVNTEQYIFDLLQINNAHQLNVLDDNDTVNLRILGFQQ